jgi:hypothetical protein
MAWDRNHYIFDAIRQREPRGATWRDIHQSASDSSLQPWRRARSAKNDGDCRRSEQPAGRISTKKLKANQEADQNRGHNISAEGPGRPLRVVNR